MGSSFTFCTAHLYSRCSSTPDAPCGRPTSNLSPNRHACRNNMSTDARKAFSMAERVDTHAVILSDRLTKEGVADDALRLSIFAPLRRTGLLTLADELPRPQRATRKARLQRDEAPHGKEAGRGKKTKEKSTGAQRKNRNGR